MFCIKPNNLVLGKELRSKGYLKILEYSSMKSHSGPMEEWLFALKKVFFLPGCPSTSWKINIEPENRLLQNGISSSKPSLLGTHVNL